MQLLNGDERALTQKLMDKAKQKKKVMIALNVKAISTGEKLAHLHMCTGKRRRRKKSHAKQQ
jgi:hypothetical protein